MKPPNETAPPAAAACRRPEGVNIGRAASESSRSSADSPRPSNRKAAAAAIPRSVHCRLTDSPASGASVPDSQALGDGAGCRQEKIAFRPAAARSSGADSHHFCASSAAGAVRPARNSSPTRVTSSCFQCDHRGDETQLRRQLSPGLIPKAPPSSPLAP